MMMLLQIYCSISKISQPLMVLGERVTLCLVVVPLLLNSVMIMLQVVKKFCERLHWRGVPTPFPNALFLVGGIWTPHNTWFFWAHPSLHPKWHLDQFSCYSTARGYVQQTHTHRYGTSITIGHIFALCACSVA